MPAASAGRDAPIALPPTVALAGLAPLNANRPTTAPKHRLAFILKAPLLFNVLANGPHAGAEG